MAAIPSASRSESVLARQRQTTAPAVPPITFSGMKINEVQSSLIAKLHEKSLLLDQRQTTSPITRKALVQQSELIKKELDSLNQYDKDQEVPDDLRLKLELLANEIHSLKGSKSTTLLDNSNDKLKPTAVRLPPPPSASVMPTKQRSKNIKGSSRNPDIAFATEIGQGLLVEIRKLQNLLQEKEDRIKQLELKQNDSEMGYDDAVIQLRKKEESEERLQEENWNLELANQELRDHLLESNQTIAKHNAEYTKLTKQLKGQTEQIEILKAQEEKSVSIIEAMKARHEQESFNLKKLTAQTQRESSALKRQVEDLKAELQICHSKLAIKQAVHSRAAGGTDSASDTEMKQEASDDSSDVVDENLTATHSAQHSRNQALETETLKQSLAHAHRIISNLRSSAHKEKKEKFEMKKMLADSQETVEQQNRQLATCHCNRLSPATVETRKSAAGKRKPITAAKRRRMGVARRAKGLSPEDSSTEGEEDNENELAVYNNDELLTEENNDDDNEDTEDDLFDPYFSTNNGDYNAFSFSNNNNNSSSLFPVSAVLKPLSSELGVGSRIAIKCDVGVNTDPFDQVAQHSNNNAPAMESINDIDHAECSTQFDSSVSQTQDEVVTVDEKASHKGEAQQITSVHSRHIVEDNSQIEYGASKRQFDSTQESDREISKSTNIDAVANLAYQPIDINLVRIAFLERAKNTLSTSQINEILPIFDTEVREDIPSNEHHVGQRTDRLDTLVQTDEQVLGGILTAAIEEPLMKEEDKLHVEAQTIETAIEEKDAPLIEGFASSTCIQLDDEPLRAIFAAPVARSSTVEILPDQSVGPSNAVQEDNSLRSDLSRAITALEAQRIELEDAKALALSIQKEERDAHWQNELQQLVTEKEAQFQVEVAHIETKLKLQFDQQLDKQRSESMTVLKDTLEKQKEELEANKDEALEKMRKDMEIAQRSELEALISNVESYKKEARLTNQRMKEMLTKESANILIERAAKEAVSVTERKHSEVLATMIPKETALQMVQDEVTKALEKERTELVEKEESQVKELQLRLEQMISKAEAEGMTKVAVADALMKEREALAARESNMYTKEQVDVLIETAVREAINKERSEHALLLATERKSHREKEQLAIRNKSIGSKFDYSATETPKPNRASSQTPEHGAIPTITVQRSNSISSRASMSSTASTRKAAPPTLSPSVSTPAVSPLKPRLQNSNRTNSFRSKLSASLSSSNPKTKRSSVESVDSQIKSYGSVRILETTKYNSRPYQPLQARSCMNLRDFNRQASTASLSTMSSNEDNYSVNLQENPGLSFYGNSFTDMSIIMAVTQTVIGEDMYKHTRRYVGGGFSTNNHKRYFWVHPYTNTLYWSTTRPGPDGDERKTKRIFVQSVTSEPNNENASLSPKSLIISTPKRKLKITASSLERHEVWLKALTYLVQRPIHMSERISEEASYNICAAATTVEHAGHQRASYDTLNDSSNIAATAWGNSSNSNNQLYDVWGSDSGESEELIDVRQCCGGKHDISTLSKKGHHHHS